MAIHKKVDKIKDVYIGSAKIGKIYKGSALVYRSTYAVTYHVDTDSAKVEYRGKGDDLLAPSFTPAKPGYTFVGWRTDAQADAAVLPSKVMGAGSVSLYAVFRKDITVTYYDNSTAVQATTKSQYYNNGNIVSPSFTLVQKDAPGWTKRGWSTTNKGDAGITYANGATFTRDSNITLYGLYQQTITVTYYDNSTTAARKTGTRYWAPAGAINPSFTLGQAARSGWTARGWSTSNAGNGSITYANGATFIRDSNVTLYGLYQQTVTVTYYNNSATASTTTGTRYWAPAGYVNPSFALSQAAKSGWTARGWSTSNAGNGAIAYANGATFTRDSNVTLYGLYQQTITVTYYNNSTTASTTTGTRYWAPAGYVNPSFTLSQASSAGWTCRGWSTTNKGDAGITYANGATFTRDSNITLYGLYQQTVTVTYYNNSTTASMTTGTRYWAPAGYVNPSFTLSQASSAGWTCRGWSTTNKGDAGITYANGATFTRDSNITLYGLYQQTVTVTYYNNSTTASTTTGTRYWAPAGYVNPSFTLSQAARSGWTARGWSAGAAADSAIAYNNGAAFTRDSNITLYGMYQQTITVTYSGNGSTGGSVTADTGTRYYNSNTATKDPTFTLKANGFTRTGYNFNGWSGAPVATIGQVFTASASLTITATWVAAELVWVENSRFVNFSNTWTKSGITTANESTSINGKGYGSSSTKVFGDYTYAHVTIGSGSQDYRLRFRRSAPNPSISIEIAENKGGISAMMDITKHIDLSSYKNNTMSLYIEVGQNTGSGRINIKKIVFNNSAT